MKKYGDALINNTISDEQIDKLFDENEPEFHKSVGYVDYSIPIGDANFSKSQGINDFVLTFASQMTPENLHKLNQRILQRSPDRDSNVFMRRTTFEKVLLAFEMAHYPEQAESLFEEAPISEKFTPKEISNLKRVILTPIINFFKKPQVVEEVFTIEELVERIANPALTDSITNLTGQAAAVKVTEPSLTKDVDSILNETRRLLSGEIDSTSYLEKANACIGHASIGMQILGGCMRLVGKLLAGLGAVFSDKLKNYGEVLEKKGLKTSMGEDNYKLYESIQKVSAKKDAAEKLSQEIIKKTTQIVKQLISEKYATFEGEIQQEVIDKRLQIIELLLRSKYATLRGVTEKEVYQWVSQNDPKVFDFIKPEKRNGFEISQRLFDDLTDGASYDFKKGLSAPFDNITIIADPESLLDYQAVLQAIADALSAINIINDEMIQIGSERMEKTKPEQFLIDKLGKSKEMIIESLGRLELRKIELETAEPSLKGTRRTEKQMPSFRKEPRRRVTFADEKEDAVSIQSSPTLKGVTFFASEEKAEGKEAQNIDEVQSGHKLP